VSRPPLRFETQSVAVSIIIMLIHPIDAIKQWQAAGRLIR